MFPNNAMSAMPMTSLFLSPDIERATASEDFEDGGIALQDSSQGLSGFRWRCYFDASNVFVQRDGSSPVNIFSQAGITEIAFAFDQNMRHNVAYRLTNERVYLRWFDSVAQAYAVTDFGPAKNPRMALDDKRMSQVNNSDVILAYLRDGQVFYRMQRDRYATEYVVASGLADTIRLRNIGMGRNLRFQFELA